MKPLAVLLLSLPLSCSNVQVKNTVRQNEPTHTTGIHVVELFTSEGCSSCPPADRLLTKLKAEGDSNVFVLSYHVDYWNHLGWKDPFSQAAFSNRQRQYAQRLSLEGVYTPQIVVDGREEFVGSDEKRLRTVLAKAPAASIVITASAETFTSEDVRLTYSLPSPTGLSLSVALVQAEATTNVKRGENEGRSLHHVNVVHELKTVEAATAGTVSMHLPVDAKNVSLSLVVFVQQKSDGKITGAVRLPVPLKKEA